MLHLRLHLLPPVCHPYPNVQREKSLPPRATLTGVRKYGESACALVSPLRAGPCNIPLEAHQPARKSAEPVSEVILFPAPRDPIFYPPPHPSAHWRGTTCFRNVWTSHEVTTAKPPRAAAKKPRNKCRLRGSRLPLLSPAWPAPASVLARAQGEGVRNGGGEKGEAGRWGGGDHEPV